jgi:hypothetical protein
MLTFKEFLLEDKNGKNLHLEHLEDEIINFGIGGGRGAINFLQELRDMLSGSSSNSVNMTVKWDGAPAIFCGIDPSDNKFFVAKKSVFNINPKLYKTNAEIDGDLSGALNSKFKVALAELSKLGIKNVLQGDLMFTDDISTETIDDKKYFTFQPNTIVYATPVDSDFGKQISKAKIGIVFHTTYTGKSLPEMKASFGANISSLKKPTSVWMDDATYKDVSGKATFTKSETDAVTAKLSLAGGIFRRINSTLLEKFIRLQGSMTGNLSGASFKTYLNTFVRKGLVVKDVKSASRDYLNHLENHFNKNKDKVKTSGAKEKIERNKKEYLREFNKHIRNIENVISFQNALVGAKQLIISKLNSIKSIGTFIKTDKGYKVTNPEGYVAIDKSGKAVKLVDRMEFSYNNFTAIKSWDK